MSLSFVKAGSGNETSRPSEIVTLLPSVFYLQFFIMDDSESEKMAVCELCFFNFRTKHFMVTYCSNHHHESNRRVAVHWNDVHEFYETTIVREPPEDLTQRVRRNVRLCDPRLGTCRKHKCTFAHGINEQRIWNKYVWTQRKIACKFLDMYSLFCVC